MSMPAVHPGARGSARGDPPALRDPRGPPASAPAAEGPQASPLRMFDIVARCAPPLDRDYQLRDVIGDDTISTILGRVARQAGLDTASRIRQAGLDTTQLSLEFNGTALDPRRSLTESGISRYCVLDLRTHASRPAPPHAAGAPPPVAACGLPLAGLVASTFPLHNAHNVPLCLRGAEVVLRAPVRVVDAARALVVTAQPEHTCLGRRRRESLVVVEGGVSGSVERGAQGSEEVVLVFRPAAALPPRSLIRVMISGVALSDGSGAPYDSALFSFTTGDEEPLQLLFQGPHVASSLQAFVLSRALPGPLELLRARAPSVGMFEPGPAVFLRRGGAAAWEELHSDADCLRLLQAGDGVCFGAPPE